VPGGRDLDAADRVVVAVAVPAEALDVRERAAAELPVVHVLLRVDEEVLAELARAAVAPLVLEVPDPSLDLVPPVVVPVAPEAVVPGREPAADVVVLRRVALVRVEPRAGSVR